MINLIETVVDAPVLADFERLSLQQFKDAARHITLVRQAHQPMGPEPVPEFAEGVKRAIAQFEQNEK